MSPNRPEAPRSPDPGTPQRAKLWPLRLPLRSPLHTAHGTIHAREGFLLEVHDDEGHCGFGEALPLDGFGLESLAACRAALETACRALVSDPERGVEAAERACADAPTAAAALDTALLDLDARRAGLALARRLVDAPQQQVGCSALLPSEEPDAVASAAARAVEAGHRTLKLKLGGAQAKPEDDLQRVARVREAAPDARLRLDANAAWNEVEAKHWCQRLAPFAPELLEQPVAAEDVAGLARVRAQASFPIAADEAVRNRESVERILAAKAADVLVLKPAAIGGPRSALVLAALARDAGVTPLVTSFLDGAIGRMAALHVAAALGENELDAGLATAAFIAEDLGETPEPILGRLAIADAPGLGITPMPERVSTGPATEFVR